MWISREGLEKIINNSIEKALNDHNNSVGAHPYNLELNKLRNKVRDRFILLETYLGVEYVVPENIGPHYEKIKKC